MSMKLVGFVLDTNLPPTETLLMLALSDYADENGVCWPSKETLARRSRVSKRTVDKYINLLAENGWLKIEEHRGRKSNCYYLNINKIYREGQVETCKPCRSEVQPMLQVRPATHAAPEPPYNHHITPPAPSAPAPRERKPKQAKVEKPTSDHAWFTAWWTYAFLQIVGEKYAYTKKDAGQVKQLLQLIGLGDSVTRACVYLSLPAAKRFPRGSPTIGGLLCQINEVSRCDDELIDKFTEAGLLPDFDQTPKLKDFQPWKQTTESETSALSTTPRSGPPSMSTLAP